MTEEKSELMLEVSKDEKNWWQITVINTGLAVCVKADPAEYPTPKHAAFHVRQAMDGLLIAKRDGEHVNPTQVRERQRMAFRPSRKITGRKR